MYGRREYCLVIRLVQMNELRRAYPFSLSRQVSPRQCRQKRLFPPQAETRCLQRLEHFPRSQCLVFGQSAVRQKIFWPVPS